MSGEKTLTAYQREVDEWIRTVGVRYFSELTNTAVLMEEVGEVARLMARMYGDQSFKGEAADKAELGMEMADVLFVRNQADRTAAAFEHGRKGPARTQKRFLPRIARGIFPHFGSHW